MFRTIHHHAKLVHIHPAGRAGMFVPIAMAACVHLAGEAEMFTPLRQTLLISFCKVARFSPSLPLHFYMLLPSCSDLCSFVNIPFASLVGFVSWACRLG